MPEGKSGSVRITLPPKLFIKLKTSFSEQATKTSPKFELIACSQTLCIIGLPAIIANGLPGNRVDAILEGITIMDFINYATIRL